MAIDLTKFIIRFIEEARDHIQRLNEGISALEQGDTNPETINAIFRSAHTIKGSSRMLKLNTVSELAHKMEDVLGALRDGSKAFTPELAQVLYRAIDGLAAMVDQLDSTKDGASVTPASEALFQALAQTLEAGVVTEAPKADITLAPAATTPPIAATTATPSPVEVTPPPVTEQASTTTQLKTSDTVRIRLNKLDELLGLMGEVLSSHSRMRQRLFEIQHFEREATQKAIPTPENTMLLQQLHAFNKDFKNDVQLQEVQMNELLDKALIMRMLPLAIVFEPATRIVRELGQSVGKQVSCQIIGADIELDRQLIDKLADPIIHLIRNAIDHGIESADKRLAAGKAAQGKITLSARQDAGWVLIEVGDDGGGIPIDTVRDKAIRKGITSAEKAATLSEHEIIDFIFLPGFSTNAIITDLSGRGVGMDVVKKTIIEDLHGSVAVETQTGIGTRFQLRLPMSLAVMRVLLVQAGGHTWGFTAQYVSELLRVAPANLLTITERQAIILRNEFIPVVSLRELTGIADMSAANSNRDLLLVVIQVRSEKIALIVDQLEDERDMVIKPLPKHLQFIEQVSGMVVTGKNALVNILHAPALLAMARQSRRKTSSQETEAHNNQQHVQRVWHILVVDDSLNTREIEKDVLEAYGYQVTLAEDGQDGLNKAREGDFDAVLTDVEMPNMDGFTLTATLRQEEKYRHKPIIIITSREKEEDKRRGVQVGADAYIVKGDFDQSNLVETLNALLG
jgi:chemotaxis protein histidine kinase CheA/ActR/RegA family two-component response regulator